ncbi:hypothetical protein GOP47_0025843 [Adiantum capillus-veneris]|uniref:Protein LUTEIN DEFICIENT 5, chloroplastic n=1 Tax=Adiantum capillus-veneris TaxID=13818 RepID=A0A9D4U111_ADICA|nr:hypothetical protein GOP47_0025843 [Adiantum capillus-veneris]
MAGLQASSHRLAASPTVPLCQESCPSSASCLRLTFDSRAARPLSISANTSLAPGRLYHSSFSFSLSSPESILSSSFATNASPKDSGDQETISDSAIERSQRVMESKSEMELRERILAGEFSVQYSGSKTRGVREFFMKWGKLGRSLAYILASSERSYLLRQAKKVPEAKGDVRAITGQPFFIPLYDLYLTYGGIFRLNFGPKSFLIISDPAIAKHLLKENSKAYSKGILAEILEFVMGKGLIPADDEVWRVRRRAIVPALHRKYVSEMVGLFGRAAENLCHKLDTAAKHGEDVEMESLFSHLTLDIIGKAVFNYDFNSLSRDTGVVEAVYTVLREAEHRSIAIIPYWDFPIIKDLSPRQRKVAAALKFVNETLNDLISICKKMVDEENLKFEDDYMNERDPSILHFLLASGDDVSSKQLRDDLMTLLIAGHETSAAVLTWAFYLLAQNPTVLAKLQHEVDLVLGDRMPTIEDMKKLKYTTRVINETLRLYPQPPVLIRRSLEEDVLGNYPISKGEDIFISVWNLHRSPVLWEDPEVFRPERWPVDGPDPTEVTENFRYLPFGGGPRKCVGDMFATFENITAVAMVVRRFNFELALGAPPVGMTTGATIHTTAGLNMTVTHRIRPPVIPVIGESTITTIEENGSVKSSRPSNGVVTLNACREETQKVTK